MDRQQQDRKEGQHLTSALKNCWFCALSESTQVIENPSCFISFGTTGRNFSKP
jgi:hypothetical protein